MAIIDRIKFDGLTSREWLVYRYPGEEFVTGTVLIVGEGQAAVFIKGGRICDVFTAGTYKLSTANLPILHNIVDLPFGNKTPFTAEVYFVNTTTKLDLYWGTTDPIQVIDPKYFVPLHIRSFGQFGLKIKDPLLFLKEVIGALGDSAVSYKKVTEFYKGLLVTKIKTILSGVIINQKISAFEITPKLEEISDIALAELKEEFQIYGFEAVNFYIQSVNFPDEDIQRIQDILEEKAAFEIMGDNRYATKRSFDVYEEAAGNSSGIAGAFAAAGIGAGMGAALMRNNPGQSVVPETAYCPSCNMANQKGARFCSSCGTALEEAKIKCYKCGTEIPAGSKFCNECGAPQTKIKCECGNVLEPGMKFCPDCGKKTEG